MKSLIFGLLLSQVAFAKNNWESGTKKIPLIELYSSEGCSSCPPAEKWMAELKNNADHFVKFTPINFHVDYWNRLGWVDRFSKSQFTERQKRYSEFWGTGKIYTPAFVVDGVDRGATGNSELLSTSGANERSVSGNLIIKQIDAQTFKVTFDTKTSDAFEVHFAELANDLKSVVTSGENEGKTLNHNFVVIWYSNIELSNKTALLKLHHEDSKMAKVNSFAIWITKKGQSIPIQSLGGYLE